MRIRIGMKITISITGKMNSANGSTSLTGSACARNMRRAGISVL